MGNSHDTVRRSSKVQVVSIYYISYKIIDVSVCVEGNVSVRLCGEFLHPVQKPTTELWRQWRVWKAQHVGCVS